MVESEPTFPRKLRRLAPRTNAEGVEKPNNKRNFEFILLKLHKKPPAVEQRERFFRIFAPDG